MASSAEASKAIVLRYIGCANDRDYAGLDALRAPNFQAHVPRNDAISASEPLGGSTLNEDLAMVSTAFPDLRVSAEDVLVDGDRVVVRAEDVGTHLGEMAGIAPTGKRIAWDTVQIFRIADGLIAEAWFITDTLGLLRQMGAVNPPPAAPEK